MKDRRYFRTSLTLSATGFIWTVIFLILLLLRMVFTSSIIELLLLFTLTNKVRVEINFPKGKG
jgi:hypothetical protein